MSDAPGFLQCRHLNYDKEDDGYEELDGDDHQENAVMPHTRQGRQASISCFPFCLAKILLQASTETPLKQINTHLDPPKLKERKIIHSINMKLIGPKITETKINTNVTTLLLVQISLNIPLEIYKSQGF